VTVTKKLRLVVVSAEHCHHDVEPASTVKSDFQPFSPLLFKKNTLRLSGPFPVFGQPRLIVLDIIYLLPSFLPRNRSPIARSLPNIRVELAALVPGLCAAYKP
jgi:hypothetical protein